MNTFLIIFLIISGLVISWIIYKARKSAKEINILKWLSQNGKKLTEKSGLNLIQTTIKLDISMEIY